METKFLRYVLRPHWKRLSAALAAVCIIGLTDVLEPWPIKIVLDYVVGSKQMPQWVSALVERTFGGNKLAILLSRPRGPWPLTSKKTSPPGLANQ